VNLTPAPGPAIPGAVPEQAPPTYTDHPHPPMIPEPSRGGRPAVPAPVHVTTEYGTLQRVAMRYAG